MLRLVSRIWFPNIIFWKAAAARRTTRTHSDIGR